MAVLVTLNPDERFLVVLCLVQACADVEEDRQEELIEAVCTVCEGLPFIITEQDRAWLADVLMQDGAQYKYIATLGALIGRLQTTRARE